MRTSTLLSTLATATLASARIVGLAAPRTLAPSQPFTLTLISENYIQSVADISIAWGYSPAPGFPQTLGAYTNSSYLGPSKSNQRNNITLETVAPAELDIFADKNVTLAASLFSLYGASGSPAVLSFNVTVNVGDETSEELVVSQGYTTGVSS